MRTFLAAVLFAASAFAQERSLYWERYDVAARLDAEGLLHVVETLDYVFTGDWNGGERRFETRLKERIELRSIEWIAASGDRLQLREDSDVDQVDEYDWSHPNLRWRARLPSDPPFDATRRRYRIEYVLRGAVDRTADGYRIDWNVAPTDLAGPIELLTWNLEVDPAWRIVSGEGSREGSLRNVLAGQFVTITLELEHTGNAPPAAVARPTSFAVAGAGGLLLLALGSWSVWSFFRDERRKGRFEPLEPLDAIDRAWLEEHVFRHKPEVIGAAWDERTGSSEVAAVLARMVQEKKLSSRVEEGGLLSSPVLHLELLVPRESITGYERSLINGLFISGKTTNTKKVRKYYRKKKRSFNPASRIEKPLENRVDDLAARDKAPSGWKARFAIAGALAGIALIVAGAIVGSIASLAVGGAFGGVAIALTIFAVIAAADLQKRVGAFLGPAIVIGISFVLMAIAFFAPLALWRETLPAHPLTVAGLALLIAALIDIVLGVARYRQSRQRMDVRRNLLRARLWFERELGKPSPSLEDAWFPYLLAFGLGPHVDRWFHAFGTTAAMAGTGTGAFASSGGGSSSSWSGGGGSFGGGGASGAWGVAAASLGAGVSASSGGSGGGGGGSSGGGGAGGW